MASDEQFQTAQSLLRMLRVAAAEKNHEILRAFVETGAGMAQPTGHLHSAYYRNSCRLPRDSAWSKLDKDQLIEALRICEKAIPGLLFQSGQTQFSTIDKLYARFRQDEESAAERAEGHSRVIALVAEFSENLRSMRGISYETFRALPLEQQVSLLGKFEGGSLEFVVRRCLDMGKLSLFEAFGKLQCDTMTHDELIVEYGSLLSKHLRDPRVPLAGELNTGLQAILRERDIETGAISVGWNPGRQVRQFQVRHGHVCYVQTHVHNGHSTSVRRGDIVVFNPKKGTVLLDTVVRKVVAVNFRVVCTPPSALIV